MALKSLDIESLVEARALISHLQAAGETHRAALAQTVHDEIAGLMVAALMDLTAAVAKAPILDTGALAQLLRAQRALVEAIERSRELIEQLRPSLLDHIGLFAALKWQVESARRQFNVSFSESYAEREPELAADASIALFRVAEEALAMTFRRGEVTIADLRVSVELGNLVLELSDNGVPALFAAEAGAEEPKIVLAAMRHRMSILGGTVEVERDEVGKSRLVARLPLT